MSWIQPFIEFILSNRAKLLEQTLEHIGLTFISLLIAIAIAMPLGILISRRKALASPILGFAGVLQTIPSIALLGFLIPILGIGVKPAIFALFLYALLPILRNTYTGIRSVNEAVTEAAKGMGMTSWQILWKVELPLALPVIFAGIRTATVINVGVATLAAYIGAGGLGEFIFGGIALNNSLMILGGAIPAALLAILFDSGLGLLQRVPARKLLRTAGFLILLIPLLSASYFVPNSYIKGLEGGFPPEFMGRADGYNKLVDTYALEFNTVVLGSAMMYKALRDGYVDVIGGYSTDGRIKAYELKILEDDLNAFPPYFCTPIANRQTLEKYPELEAVLNMLTGQIDDAAMTELNYQVDFEKQSPEAVARNFLKSIDLYKPDRITGGDVITIGSKIFTEQYILGELFAQLINGYTDLDVDLKTGLGGTQICFESLVQGEIDLYPEYTGTGFLVLLTPPDDLVSNIISDKEAVYDYVKEECRTLFQIDWLEPIGFNNTYALMVRSELAREMGWERVSDLR